MIDPEDCESYNKEQETDKGPGIMATDYGIPTTKKMGEEKKKPNRQTSRNNTTLRIPMKK